MTAFAILWNPAGTSERAARANLAIPLLLLGAANALPSYALLARYGIRHVVQTRLDATPDGMFPLGVFFFTTLTWLSPFVLPVMAFVAAFLLDLYVGFALDTKVSRSELRRLVAWGALPLAIHSVIAGILVTACGKQCNEFNPLAANLAFFFDPKATEVFWYELARVLDVFSLWAIFITGQAIAARYQRAAAAVTFGVAALFFSAAFLRAWLLG